ncbi:MAG TPA: hypothetical protein VHI95_03545 [Acidimicrobiales bacterium]|nr:hypothetical protein [Acidimicrobiales bacterium]
MRIARLAVRSALLALLALLVLANPAHADPAKPGDFESTVTRIDPPTDAVSLKVVGGDGFLSLKVQPGHDVIVKGYAGGPWLHVRPDGVVEENQLSPATYLNANRYGTNPAPSNVTNDTELDNPPQWKQVATGGEYAWHDHRIHWMSPDDPPGGTRGQVLPQFNPWKVSLTVDNKPVEADGQLVWEKQESVIPWIAAGVLACAVTIFLGKGRSTFVAAIAVLIASVAALQTGIVAYRSIPSAAGPNPLEIVLPSFAVLAAIVGLVLHRKPFGVIAILASLAALAGWAIMRIATLVHPVLPTDLPFWLDRTSTAVAIGIAVAAAVLAVRSGALVLRLPELDFDDEPATRQDVDRDVLGERSDVT